MPPGACDRRYYVAAPTEGRLLNRAWSIAAALISGPCWRPPCRETNQVPAYEIGSVLSIATLIGPQFNEMPSSGVLRRSSVTIIGHDSGEVAMESMPYDRVSSQLLEIDPTNCKVPAVMVANAMFQ